LRKQKLSSYYRWSTNCDEA